MQKQLAQLVFIVILFACFPVVASAQTENDSTFTPSDDEILAAFMMRFDIAPPDTTFLAMETGEGWEEQSTLSRIVCSALPASFERVMQDAGELANIEGGKLISQDTLEINGVKGFLAKVEFSPGEAGMEPFLALMYMRPWGKNLTLNINAAYPKSHDARLYSKMLASFATVRKKE